ncbi:hypothetical protein PRZ48_012244 [Zasmidium cellare]|uniref:F-box domain-containing protein n=1 Tax=Zasmidium cellare TaxID=395010 RepID=A0ABR0E4C2_ZASCE|nr:hypothetical protein PRZ48_012244 [Zasmidium cellare]
MASITQSGTELPKLERLQLADTRSPVSSNETNNSTVPSQSLTPPPQQTGLTTFASVSTTNNVLPSQSLTPPQKAGVTTLPPVSTNETSNNVLPGQSLPPPQKAGLMSLPPEVRLIVLEQLDSTKDLFAMAKVSKPFLAAVNDIDRGLSAKICAKEHTRLTESIPPPMLDFFGGWLKGLTILDALRRCFLYNGRPERIDISHRIYQLARFYERDHGVFAGPVPTLKKSYTEELLEYLLHLDAAKHPFGDKEWVQQSLKETMGGCRKTDANCPCETCKSVVGRDGQSAHCYIDVAVWKFELSGWDMEFPKRFFRETSAKATRKWATEEEWLNMVRSVLETPIQQFFKEEVVTANDSLAETIWAARGCETRLPTTSMDVFVAQTGLPQLDMSTNGWTCTYIPKASASQRRQLENISSTKSEDPTLDAITAVWKGSKVWKGTRGMRAAREYCLRSREETKTERLLDPDNKLLLAAVFEEMQVSRRRENEA